MPCDFTPLTGDIASSAGWASGPITASGDWELVDMVQVLPPPDTGEGVWWEFLDSGGSIGISLTQDVVSLTTEFISDISANQNDVAVTVNGDTSVLPPGITPMTQELIAPPDGDYPTGTFFQLWHRAGGTSLSTTSYPAWTGEITGYEVCTPDAGETIFTGSLVIVSGTTVDYPCSAYYLSNRLFGAGLGDPPSPSKASISVVWTFPADCVLHELEITHVGDEAFDDDWVWKLYSDIATDGEDVTVAPHASATGTGTGVTDLGGVDVGGRPARWAMYLPNGPSESIIEVRLHVRTEGGGLVDVCLEISTSFTLPPDEVGDLG